MLYAREANLGYMQNVPSSWGRAASRSVAVASSPSGHCQGGRYGQTSVHTGVSWGLGWKNNTEVVYCRVQDAQTSPDAHSPTRFLEKVRRFLVISLADTQTHCEPRERKAVGHTGWAGKGGTKDHR